MTNYNNTATTTTATTVLRSYTVYAPNAGASSIGVVLYTHQFYVYGTSCTTGKAKEFSFLQQPCKIFVRLQIARDFPITEICGSRASTSVDLGLLLCS
jgi:hypothetical protein